MYDVTHTTFARQGHRRDAIGALWKRAQDRVAARCARHTRWTAFARSGRCVLRLSAHKTC